MSGAGLDPARLARYHQLGEGLDRELRAVAEALGAAATSHLGLAAGEARTAMLVAAARDVGQRADALWRAEVRTTRWVGAVGAAFAADTHAGRIVPAELTVLGPAAADPVETRTVR